MFLYPTKTENTTSCFWLLGKRNVYQILFYPSQSYEEPVVTVDNTAEGNTGYMVRRKVIRVIRVNTGYIKQTCRCLRSYD